MALSLSTIKPTKGTTKKRVRVGRGNSSGSGNYSGKGMKGQKSRSGVSGLKRLGMKKQLLQTPKVRGFKSKKPKNQAVDIKNINKYFKDGETVNAVSLVKYNLIKSDKLPVKILGKGKLKIKDLKFEGVIFSGSVRDQLKLDKK